MPAPAEPPHPTTTGPIRTLLTNGGGAVLAAVLLKWLCLEAYTIPSPSMQPTMLGSDAAGVFDHVLVDKAHYEFHAPQRWDLAVFRAPLQRRDVYAKRLVGLPGERIRIAGGNLHVVTDTGDDTRILVVRRPAALQRSQWRTVHPARAQARGETTFLGTSLRGEPPSAWREQADTLSAKLVRGQPTSLQWTCRDGGLVDRPWDGHPPAVAKALRAAHAEQSERAEIVPDARLAVRLTAATPPSRGEVAIEVHRPQQATLGFALVIANGAATLLVQRDGATVATSPALPFDWPADLPVELGFAHVDDELVVWRNDVELGRLDTAAFACREGCELPDTCGMGPAMPSAAQSATLRITFEGQGELRLDDLRIWRDQHWTRGPLAVDADLVVPEDHYLLLGDNPLQSEDGRGWRSFAIGALAGDAVPPGTPGATLLVGSRRTAATDAPPARDENPILLPTMGRLACRDRHGEWSVLRYEAGPEAGPDEVSLRWHDPAGTVHDWRLDGAAVHFVPRGDLVGRAIACWWPFPPFGPARLGWLR